MKSDVSVFFVYKMMLAVLTFSRKLAERVVRIGGVVFIVMLLHSCTSSVIQQENQYLLYSIKSVIQQEIKDPLNIGTKGLNALLNKKIPYDKWDVWGEPETLMGTNNNRWVVYLTKANISFISDKNTDKILAVIFGKAGLNATCKFLPLADNCTSLVTREEITIQEILVGLGMMAMSEDSSIIHRGNKDPLNIGIKSLFMLLDNEVPTRKWPVWGKPETLAGTNNNLWVAYLPKANVSFVSYKKTNKVILATFGRVPVADVKVMNSWIEDAMLILFDLQ